MLNEFFLTFSKFLMSLLAETKRRALPTTKYFSFWSIWQRFVKEILFVSEQIKYESFERKIAVARWRIVSSEKNTNEYIFVTSTKMRENSH